MSFIPNTTPTPNWLYNGEMNKMTDTELRVVLIITRATLGWVEENGLRKNKDWISQKSFMKKSGKSNRAIATAIDNSLKNGWIEAYDKNDNQLLTPESRSGNRVYYRLGNIFRNKITSEDTSQVLKPVNLTTKTSELNDTKPVNLLHSTKETHTKETIQKLEVAKAPSFFTLVKNHFVSAYKLKFGEEPAVNFAKDGKVVKGAAGLFKDINKAYQLIDDFLYSPKGEEKGYTLSICFSAHTINLWKAKKLNLGYRL